MAQILCEQSGLAELSEFLTATLYIKPQSGLLIRLIRLIRGSSKLTAQPFYILFVDSF